jgi:uncharacterized protein YndB with AHSA1/START domain
MEYRTSIDIDAPPETVWAVLADVERWPEWTRSMEHVEFVEGAGLKRGAKVRIKQPRLPVMTWEVIEVEPHRVFTWQAKSGGMTSVGDHRLSVTSPERTTAELSIRQTGALAPIIGLFTSGMVRRYVQMEADGLKRRSES